MGGSSDLTKGELAGSRSVKRDNSGDSEVSSERLKDGYTGPRPRVILFPSAILLFCSYTSVPLVGAWCNEPMAGAQLIFINHSQIHSQVI